MLLRLNLGPRGLLLLFAAMLLVAHASVFNFVNDDAFISFRYADNLVRHGELTFNLGERVEGYTNFLWTILLAVPMSLGGDPVLFSKLFGVGFALGTLVVTLRLLSVVRGERRTQDAVAAVFLAASPSYAAWSTGGLETQQFTFLLTLSLLAYVRESRLLGVALALASMARPEGMLLCALLGLHRGLRLLWRRHRPGGFEGAVLLGFALIFGPYFAARWAYYGWPLPNTYYVKAGAMSFYGPGLLYLKSFILDHHLYLIPPLLLAARRHRLFLTLFGVVALGLGFHVVRVGGDFMGQHRFLVPLLPLLAVVVVLGGEEIVKKLVEMRLPRKALVALGLALISGLTARVVYIDRQAMEPTSEGGVDRIGWLKMFAAQCQAIGEHLAKTAPPDASIATTAAGTIPYYSRLYTLDVLGLNDEYIAHEIPAHGSRPGHTKSAPESYVLSKDIDYLVYHPTITERPIRQSASAERAWAQKGYRWESVEVPGLVPPHWGVWRRAR